MDNDRRACLFLLKFFLGFYRRAAMSDAVIFFYAHNEKKCAYLVYFSTSDCASEIRAKIRREQNVDDQFFFSTIFHRIACMLCAQNVRTSSIFLYIRLRSHSAQKL